MANIEKRTNQDGTITYRVKVRLKGYPAQTATFERITDAKIWAQHTEAAIREGRHFKTSEAKRHTLAELIDRYCTNVLPKKSSSPHFVQNQKKQLEWWKEQIGAYSLAEITPALIAEQRDKLSNTLTHAGTPYSPATVKRYLAALSHAFTVSVREWGWLEYNPVLKVSRPREENERIRFLSDKERYALLEACRNHPHKLLYPVVVIALSTGARQMEILRLRWSDIDLQRGVITLHKTKNKERRVIPLTGYALGLVKKMAESGHKPTDLVFAGRNKAMPFGIDRVWREAMKAAELEDFRFHDLRHTAASYLAMNGATTAEIAAVLGHKTLQMVKRYAHLSEAHTAAIVEKMNKKVFG